MASVDLMGVYIAPADDLEDILILNASVKLSDRPAVQGEHREYAGGRWRTIRRPGTTNTVSVSITRASRDQREALAELAGQTLLLRDGRGRFVFGDFLDLPAEESPGLPFSKVSFTLFQTTHDIEV
jgi:hypothetical protein